MSHLSKNQLIIRSRQLNPCDDLFWKSRGYAYRPSNWQQLLHEMGYYDNNDQQSDDYYEEEEYYCEDHSSDCSCSECEYSDEEYDDDDYDDDDYDETEDDEYEIEAEKRRQENNLRSRQMNPCDILYWTCRGYATRPHNWRQLVYGH